MQAAQIPCLILGLTVAVYWGAVLRMIVRVSRKTREVRPVLVPSQRREQLMWLVWVPLVAAWIALPLSAGLLPAGGDPWLRLSASVAQQPVLTVLRWLAACVGVLSLLLSLRCWEHMGRHWRMAVDPEQASPLFTDGPFALVRHPIYALSIALMLCTVVTVPTWPMLLVAVVHIGLMNIKARSEEAFLLARHGESYAEYCRCTGRFVPRRPPRDQERSADLGTVRFGPVPLNGMQQAMLHWEEIHPYVAVHAVRLRGPGDVAGLRAAARLVCAEAGLGVLRLDGWAKTLAYHALRDVPVEELPAAADPDGELRRVLSDEINRPFPLGPHHPLRWKLFDEADRGAHYVVLAYHHVVADAFSIERLLAAVLRRYRGRQPLADEPRLGADVRTANRWISRLLGRQGRLRTVYRAVRLFRQVHYVHRLKEAKPGTDATAVEIITAPDGLLERVRAFCRARSVSINDAFLAALSAAVAECTLAVGSRDRGEPYALGMIHSLRRGAPDEVARHLGVALGKAVLLPGDPDCSLNESLIQIARARRRCPPEQQAATLDMCYRMARVFWPVLLKPNRRRTYRKAFPIAAGLSAYVVDASLFADPDGEPTRYVRASPSGPAIPLVLAPTAFGGRLELALIHRDVRRGCGDAAVLLKSVVAHLRELAGSDAAEPIAGEAASRQEVAG